MEAVTFDREHTKGYRTMLRLVSEQQAKQQGWLTLSLDDLDEQEVEQCPLIHRAPAPSIPESGIRFQRCGGGRRIIRKQRGAN